LAGKQDLAVELNHILLFLAVVSPVAVLARSWRPYPGNGAWRIAAVVVLSITGLAWLIARHHAGYIGAGAWFAVLFVPAVGLKRMTDLSYRHHFASAKRLAKALLWLHPTSDVRDQIQVFSRLEAQQLNGDLPGPISNPNQLWWRREKIRVRTAPVIVLMIIANILLFGVELISRSTGSEEGLLRLGALLPSSVLFGHEHWRLFAALFLHAGWIHLLFNLFALYILGPPFERAIGSIRFLACYLISGICSTTGVVLLWRLGKVENAILVGASGCVMGIVGAWAAYLLRNHQTPLARRRLGDLLMIVVIQTIFDKATPQVSMAAHLCGLIGGFLVGFAISPRNANHYVERASFSA
jgi:membrane associated rhomboid family serine protease